jgi:hypothetical protein
MRAKLAAHQGATGRDASRIEIHAMATSSEVKKPSLGAPEAPGGRQELDRENAIEMRPGIKNALAPSG